MGESIKQIAVLLGAINLDNQKKLLEGMEHAAKEANCNLFVFTNYVGTRETEENVMASSQILRLPEFDKFDGVILVPNTIHNPMALNKVLGDLSKLDKPKVCIDRPMEGMSDVGTNSYTAEYEMVEHFIQHGYRDIICVTGVLHVSSEAKKRLLAYQDAMKNNGLEYSEKNVYEGAFTLETGAMIGKQLLKEGRCPEAIICGNDDMAHGIIDVFKKAGIRIPEDVKIAGFDNGEMSRLNRPTLTTVDKNQHGVGYKAVYEILDLMNGKEPASYELPCKAEYRESCGCNDEAEFDIYAFVEDLKKKYVTQQVDTIFLTDVVRGMITDFAKAKRPEDLFDVSIMDHFRADDKNVFIIFMDADGLKTVNDTLGHEAGDLLIREIGAIVHKNTSSGMLGMRYGGDEFVIFGGFSDEEPDMVDKVIAGIKAEIIRVNESRKYPFLVSVSIGSSKWRAREIENLETLIEQADKEMYQEKQKKKRGVQINFRKDVV